MSALSLFGKYEEIYLKNLIIVPILGQMLHFYLTHNYGNLVKNIIEITPYYI